LIELESILINGVERAEREVKKMEIFSREASSLGCFHFKVRRSS